MASKRKSSIPCMVPAKTKTQREEIVVGCLPELLPTIPEDRILSIFGEKGVETQRATKHSGKSSSCVKGTHSCPPCSFETTDLNLFLHHMDTCHIDFQTQPLYYCLNCNISLGKFEGLVLHNAKIHPQLHMEGGCAKSSLQVTKKGGVLRVEQILFTEKEEFSQSGVSIIKMPIMKMMVNGEQKDAVVSHMVQIQRTDMNNDKPVTIRNGTAQRHVLPGTAQVVTHNVSFPMQKRASTYNIPTQNKRPFWNFTPSSPDLNSDLPKVMIPLSSIPTYDPAMDLSSFLKSSFGKFPYPTKAELCYLTVVSGFPEEQIKLWFAAQRLKQGISWSPEEIEETRKKMFNTVFQATPRSSQKKSPYHVPQHCVAFQPSTVSSNFVPHIQKVNEMGWKKGPVPLKVQGNFQHGIAVKEIETAFFLDKTDSVNQANVDSSNATRKDNGLFSSIKNSTIHQTSSNGRQNSEYHDVSVINLNNIVRKLDCIVNNKEKDYTSKPNTDLDCEFSDKHANTNDTCNTHFTSSKSNNGIVYNSTSLSIICTKKEGIVTDHTSKETGESMPILSNSLGAQTSGLSNTFLCKSKSPEELQVLKQSITHCPILEEKNSVEVLQAHSSADTQSAMEHFPGTTTAAPPNEAPLQPNNIQPSNMAITSQLDKLCPKAFPGISQVLSPDLPLDDAISYKDHDANCLKHSPSAI